MGHNTAGGACADGFTLGADGESVDTQTEFMLVQSTALAPGDPAYQAVIQDTVDTLQTFPQVQDLRSPLDPAQTDLVSADGTSVMIQFTPAGAPEPVGAYRGGEQRVLEPTR